MAIEISRTARGVIRPATPEEIAREQLDENPHFIATDLGLTITTDSGDAILMNVPDFGFTNPDLHRRVDQDPEIPVGSDYPFIKYDNEGNAYKQDIVIGVWDGINSYRTTSTYTHDEESTTCEIP